MTQTIITREQEKLGRAAALVNEVIDIAGEAGVTEAKDKAADALRLMLRAGAPSPFKTRPTAPEADLAQLAALDSPEARALFLALSHVQDLAEAVDAQRGRTLPEEVPLQPGESRGTDYAETISNLAQRLKVEIFGPAGKDG